MSTGTYLLVGQLVCSGCGLIIPVAIAAETAEMQSITGSLTAGCHNGCGVAVRTVSCRQCCILQLRIAACDGNVVPHVLISQEIDVFQRITGGKGTVFYGSNPGRNGQFCQRTTASEGILFDTCL